MYALPEPEPSGRIARIIYNLWLLVVILSMVDVLFSFGGASTTKSLHLAVVDGVVFLNLK